MIFLLVIALLLCWGSFLNVVGHRLITNQDIVFLRSHCPHCNTTLAWYDLIPLVSWIWLRGRCRYCNQPISHLYPFIELLTALIGILLFARVSPEYWITYGIFFSALIISIRTDLEYMLLSQYMTLCLVPLGILAATMNHLPITPLDSIIGAVCGYLFFYLLSTLFRMLTGKECIGDGDLDLLAFIGAFTGLLGCWLSLTIGSLIGSIFGIAYLIKTGQNQDTRIPFGPFLATGAIIYILFECEILSFFLY